MRRCAALLLAAASCRRDEPGAPTTADAARARNVVIVTFDTTRADRLGCYGGAADVAPAVDALARRGTLFEHAYAVAPLTLPSHASLLTGLLPFRHGARENGLYRVARTAPTLAITLAARGFATAAFVSAFVLDPEFGLDSGFARYDAVARDGPDAARDGRVDERRAAVTAPRAAAWLAQAPEPFFAWVHFFDPHQPQDPEEPFRSRLKGRPYEAEIAAADDGLRQVLAAVQARGADARTLVVVAADHGEGLGDHGESSHGCFLWDTTLRVPLIVAGPGVAAGRRIAATASLVDVVPTLLELLAIPDDQERQGRSRAAALAAGAGASDEGSGATAWLESEMPRVAYGWKGPRGLVRDGWRYLDCGTPQLYAPDDRREEHDLAAAEPARVAAFAAELARWRQLEAAATAQFEREAAPSDPAADAATRAGLARLGYLAGGARTPVRRETWQPAELVEVLRLREQGFLALARGRFAEAEPKLRALVERTPGSAEGLELLGTVLVFRGKALAAADPARTTTLAECTRVLEAALALEPRLLDARFNLAVARHELGDDAAAQAELARVLELDPRYAGARKLQDEIAAAHR